MKPEPEQPAISPNNGKRGCDGKRRYLSFSVADLMAKRVRRYMNSAARAYRCRVCADYHVGGVEASDGDLRRQLARRRDAKKMKRSKE